jgi:hypothetical protein
MLSSHTDKGTKNLVQRLANAMASAGPTPIKFHEAAAMALARCVKFELTVNPSIEFSRHRL